MGAHARRRSRICTCRWIESIEEVEEVGEEEEVEAAVVEVDAKIVLVPVRFRAEPGGNARTWRS